MLRFIVSFTLVVMCWAVLVQLYVAPLWAGPLAAGALFVFVVLGQRWFTLRERLLLFASVVVTIAAFLVSHAPWLLILSALERAAFLAAFMLLLALLKEAASTSDAVLGVGQYLTKQPPGRRYLANHVGGHVLGVPLNFGVLSLLGPLIQRGVRADAESNPLVAEIRERRQLTALARGFSAIIAWSPTSVSQATIPVMVIGAEAFPVAAMGFCVMVVMIFIGWAEDKLRFKSLRAKLDAQGIQVPVEHPVFPARDFKWFLGICLLMVALAVSFMLVFNVRIVPALMLAAPLITCFWFWLQNRSSARARELTLARCKRLVSDTLPSVSPEAITLSAAGYVGMVAGGLIPGESFAETLGLETISPVIIYIAVAGIMPLASCIAMPPMMVGTFFAAMLTSQILPELDMSMLGFAIAMGWMLNLTGSPFGATNLILSRVTGLPGTTLSWRWNGVYTLLMFAVVVAAMIGFANLRS
ncbi:MAG: hypothetical protein ACR2OJ_17505 [Hyphomicrobiales bacterium]